MAKKQGITERRAALSAEQRALLEKRLHGKPDSSGKTGGEQHIPRRQASGPAPLSFAQERLWFLDQLSPGSSTFNEYVAIPLNQAFDVDLLRRSIDEIIRRHDILRTTFQEVDGRPVQVVAPSLSIELLIIDLTSLPPAQREAETSRIAHQEVLRPFDLTRGPLVRMMILRLGMLQHIFLFTMHHIVSDGWSMGVFARELTALYAAFSARQPSPLPELSIQYADYAAWQRNWLQGKELERHLAYWRQKLADLPALELPTDRPRPVLQSFCGAREALKLPQVLTEEIKNLCQREGVTLFMTLLAAFKALLYHYTGQEDLVIGTYIAGRNRAEIEPLIGFFINTLVLRTDLSGNPEFRVLLQRVREVTLDAYAHLDLPFPKLVEELQPERDLSRNPLFQVVFQLANVPTLDSSQPHASAPELVQRNTSAFDLVVHFNEAGRELLLSFEYSTDLFDALTIKRLASHFLMVLEAITANPDLRLAEIPLLSAVEWEQVLSEWNATERAYHTDRSLVQRFQELAERNSSATAFVYGNRPLSYGALNLRANQLANYLCRLGVEPETLVGICLERSLDVPVALLGVYKAGGAYLPLDPSYPRERLAFMLQDAGVSILISRSDLLDKLPTESVKTVCIDTDAEELARQDDKDPTRRVDPGHLAYVIYTSGSTGRPKGVAVAHSQILNRLEWMWEAYPFMPDEVNCQKTALSFVDSIWEFFGALLQNIPTVIIPDEALKDPYLLVRMLETHHISRIWLVPSLLRLLLDTYPDLQDRLPALKFWVTTGEALPFELLQRFRQLMPDSALYNLYGTSEVWDVTWFDTREQQGEAWHVPIGRPIANMRVYALDARLQPAPVGVPGELYVGGVGVARGYMGRPQLTAQQFIPDPFSYQSGARIYKTGDLVRYRPDGNLEYLGRIDHQIKMRGHRIELGEVEAVLQQHPGVKQAIVAMYRDGSVDQKMVAYLIQDPDFQGSLEESAKAAWAAEQVPRWREVWDETYRQTPTEKDPTFNIVGFNSSYDGSPIPSGEVHEWVSQAVDIVLSRRPQRVLDIGCGMGLLLFRIAPYCAEYLATDLSPVTLRYLKEILAVPEHALPQVRLLERTADDFTGIEVHAFDMVILHSVVQYFPNVDYLVQVLQGAVQVVAPGGVIFVGDVRSLPLLEAFHAAVELMRAPATLPLEQFRQAVDKRMSQEKELVLHPAFFLALQQHLPEITSVRIELKRGHQQNEFSRFRYNVLLQVGEEIAKRPEPIWLDWEKQALELWKLKEILRDTELDLLGVRRIPNSRIAREVAMLDLLANPDEIGTIGQLRDALDVAPMPGIDPEDIWGIAQELPYSVQICWSSSGGVGAFDVLFQRRGEENNSDVARGEYWLPDATIPTKPWSHYASNPLQAMFASQLVPQLRQFLQDRLPEYMVPAYYVLLNTLPLTPSGKLDRRRLPAPDQLTPQLQAVYVAPRNSLEEVLAELFAQVLGLEQVGIHDHFFAELGGHSLLATQLVSKIRTTLQVELPLRHVFDAPTVAGLVDIFRHDPATGSAVEKTAELVLMVMSLSDQEVEMMLAKRTDLGGLR